MQICEIIVASDVWMRRTITLQNYTIHHGRGTFIMAFESLQHALSRPAWQLGYVANRWARKSQQARFESSRCLHHGASEETTLANVGKSPPLLFSKSFLTGRPETYGLHEYSSTHSVGAFLMHKITRERGEHVR